MLTVEPSLFLFLGSATFAAIVLIGWSLFLNKESVYKVEMFKIGFTFILVGLTGLSAQFLLSSESFRQNMAYDQAKQEREVNKELVDDVEELIDQRLSTAKQAINDFESLQQVGEIWTRYQESAINWDTRVPIYHDRIKSFAGEDVANELYVSETATTTMHYLFTQAHNRLLGIKAMSDYISSTTPSYAYQNYFSSLEEANSLLDKLVEKKTKLLTELNTKLDEQRGGLRTSP